MKEVMFFKLPIHDDLDNAAIDLGFDTVQNLSAVPRVRSHFAFLLFFFIINFSGSETIS